MHFTRWYDSDNNIKFIVNVLEKMDSESRKSLAADIIQILINDKGQNTDELIENITANPVLSLNRWYDQDETVHSAVEMLKFTDNDEKKELLKEFLYSIVNTGEVLKLEERE